MSGFFVALMMIILAVLDHFEQKLSVRKENLQHEDSKRVFGHIRAHTNHPFLSERANITKNNPSITFTFHKNARILLLLTS